jgi:hypothetical protein
MVVARRPVLVEVDSMRDRGRDADRRSQVRPSSVERFTNTVGTLVVGVSGMDETSQTPCAAS